MNKVIIDSGLQLLREFPSKGWNVCLVYKLFQKLQITESSTTVTAVAEISKDSASLADSINLVDELVLHNSSISDRC